MLPLEFVVPGIPISAQAKHGSPSKKRWMASVASAAQMATSVGASLVGHNVFVRVVYYYTVDPLDVDNMLKPILDAMNGIVYRDDRLVTDVRAAKREIVNSFDLESATQALADAIGVGTDLVHIRVEDAPDPRTPL